MILCRPVSISCFFVMIFYITGCGVVDITNLPSTMSALPITVIPQNMTNGGFSINQSQIVSNHTSNVTYSIQSGYGSVNPTSGIFTPGYNRGTTAIKATHANGTTAVANVYTLPVWTNAAVSTSATDSDGNLYLGGNFTEVGIAQPAPKFTSVDTTSGDTKYDCSFEEGFNGDVNAILRTSDAIFVGGNFTYYKGVSVGYLVKLDTNCVLDTTFTNVGSGFSGQVKALATSGTSLYVGGAFTAYRGVANSAQRLAKLDLTTGNLDAVFTVSASGFGGTVNALAVSSTSLYVGGAFTAYRGVAASAQYLAKIDLTSGNLDTTFTTNNSGFNGAVLSLALNSTSIYVGGSFTDYRGVVSAALRLAKLDLSSGNLDTVFTASGSGFNGDVNAIAINATDVYVGGAFIVYRGVINAAVRLAKLDIATGVLDTTFTVASSGLDSTVSSLALSGTSLFVGGTFTAYRGVANSAQRLAKVNATSGALDTTFTINSRGLNTGSTYALTVSGTTLYAGGSFTSYRTVANNAQFLVKITSAGVIDTTFTQPGNGFNSVVRSIVVSGTSIYVGGVFTSYRGVANNAQRLAKLDLTTGDLDTTFTVSASGFNSSVQALAVSGTSLYVGGYFTDYRGVGNSAMYLAKLDLTSGNLDAAFTQPGSGFDGISGGYVTALLVNGTSLYAGGYFTDYRGGSNNAMYLAKVDLTSGNLDTTFTSPGSGFDAGAFTTNVGALAYGGGALYVGGDFGTYRGSNASFAAKLDATSGVLDTTFTAATGMFNNVVSAIYVEGSSIYIGGNFIFYRGVTVSYLCKLDTSGVRDTSFTNGTTGPNGAVSTFLKVGTKYFIGGSFTLFKDRIAYYFTPIDISTGTIE